MKRKNEKTDLQIELKFFESNKAKWLEKYRDKYLLIKREELIDAFVSLEDAYKEGVKRFGNEPFLIKQVAEVEPVEKTPALVLGVVNANL